MQIPRSQNMVADEVAKLAPSEEESTSIGLEMEVQKRPSIEEISTFTIQKLTKKKVLKQSSSKIKI